jgi:hypothetical protein
MRQEDYNDMMKTPEEGFFIRTPRKPSLLPKCPRCGEEYLGNGKDLCVDCKCVSDFFNASSKTVTK